MISCYKHSINGHSLILVFYFALFDFFLHTIYKTAHAFINVFIVCLSPVRMEALWEQSLLYTLLYSHLGQWFEQNRWLITIHWMKECHYFISQWFFWHCHSKSTHISTIWRCHYVLPTWVRPHSTKIQRISGFLGDEWASDWLIFWLISKCKTN